MPASSTTLATATLLSFASAASALHARAPLLHATRPAAARSSSLHGLRSQIPAERVEEEAAAPKAAKKERLNVRIDDEWYDLTGFRAAHPAGSHWIDAYNNQDATEVLYGFHS